MGLNTTVFILNDLWNDYRDNPKRLVDTIEFGFCNPNAVERSGGGVRAVRCFHSSMQRLFLCGGNMMKPVAAVSEDENVDMQLTLLKRAADALGYRLVKKRKKR